jgi:hypothetical protein
MWFIGYIAPNLVNQPNEVMGLPADYVPYQTPINRRACGISGTIT